MRFILGGFPMPPGMNNLYPTGRNGRRYKARHSFFDDMEKYWYRQTAALKYVRERCKEMKLEVDRYFCFHRSSLYTKAGRPKRMDVTNRIKAFDDELSKLIGVDDSLFWSGAAMKVELLDETARECVAVVIREAHPMTSQNLARVLDLGDTFALDADFARVS